VIGPACDECGYKADRADELAEPGIITSQIVDRLVESDLVVADLTAHNPNVFYELAIRHAARKPVVQMIEKGWSIPFDVGQMRVIRIDHRDLRSAAAAKAELIQQIERAEKDQEKADNPVSAAMALRLLKTSDVPMDRQLGAVVEALQVVAGAVGRMDGKVEKLEFESWARAAVRPAVRMPASGNLGGEALLTYGGPPTETGIPPSDSELARDALLGPDKDVGV